MVHIHGGGFWGGSKSARHAVRYAEAGFIGVSINYRLSGVAPFPAAVQDCKAAIRWLRANAEKYQIDAAHIGIWGTSTGGHLVALHWTMKNVYATDPGEVFWAASDVGWVVGHSYICYGPLIHGRRRKNVEV